MLVHLGGEGYFQHHHVRTDPKIVKGYKHMMPNETSVPIAFCGRSVCTLLCTQPTCEVIFQSMPQLEQYFCVLFAKYCQDQHVPRHLNTEVPDNKLVNFRNIKEVADPDSFADFTKQLDFAKIDHHHFLQGCTAIMLIPFERCYDSDGVPVSGPIFGVDIGGPCVPVANLC
jgi:hypothetical protein